jgi:hypothetical protein
MIMPRPFQGTVNLDVCNSTSDWEASLFDNAPPGAPNVLVMLDDDSGSLWRLTVPSWFNPALSCWGATTSDADPPSAVSTGPAHAAH